MIQSFFPFQRDRAESTEEKIVRLRFEREVKRSFKRLAGVYKNRNGVVLNTDLAKELCKEYSADKQSRTRFSQCIYEPAKIFTNRLFEIHVADRKLKRAVFLAGGAASGKSSALGSLKDNMLEKCLIVDGTFSEYDYARRQVEMCLHNSKPVSVVYVYCAIDVALRAAVKRAMEIGRVIPLNVFTGTHIASQRTVWRLFENYRVDTRVTIVVIDNSDFKDPKYHCSDFILEHEYEEFDKTHIQIHPIFHDACSRYESEHGEPVHDHIVKAFQREGRRVVGATGKRNGKIAG